MLVILLTSLACLGLFDAIHIYKAQSRHGVHLRDLYASLRLPRWTNGALLATCADYLNTHVDNLIHTHQGGLTTGIDNKSGALGYVFTEVSFLQLTPCPAQGSNLSFLNINGQ